MDIHGYSAHVLVNGRKVKEYRHNGLTFIEAKDGTEFAIEVKNHLSNRVLAIASVDGLDIIDGKSATAKSRGYIVKGNNADIFHGWRKSDSEVGTFKFVTSDKSYATEKGKGQNNGIIAIKLVAEKIIPLVWQTPQDEIFHDGFKPYPRPHVNPKYPNPYFPEYILCSGGGANTGDVQYKLGGNSGSSGSSVRSSGRGMSANYCSVQSLDEVSDFDMGTTWGSKREDKVTTTEFEYGNEIDTFEFYYASREALKAMGVSLINERQVPALPKAFEGEKYAQPPKNWK